MTSTKDDPQFQQVQGPWVRLDSGERHPIKEDATVNEASTAPRAAVTGPLVPRDHADLGGIWGHGASRGSRRK